MSYDISLLDPATKAVLQLDEKHQLKGGTYVLGGTKDCTLNVTYNYSKIFCRVLGKEGIRSIYGMTGQASIPVLEKAISQLSDIGPVYSYWDATDKNARTALSNLLELAKARPEGIWQGD